MAGECPGKRADGQGQSNGIVSAGLGAFHPSTLEVRSDGAEGIACWFLDTDNNEERFFVLPHKVLKTTLEPRSTMSLGHPVKRYLTPLEEPKGGRVAAKVMNNVGAASRRATAEQLFRDRDRITVPDRCG